MGEITNFPMIFVLWKNIFGQNSNVLFVGEDQENRSESDPNLLYPPLERHGESLQVSRRTSYDSTAESVEENNLGINQPFIVEKTSAPCSNSRALMLGLLILAAFLASIGIFVVCGEMIYFSRKTLSSDRTPNSK